jgi:hypothetical protein
LNLIKSVSISARRLPLFAVPLLTLALSATGADRFWDGGAANIGTRGDGLCANLLRR